MAKAPTRAKRNLPPPSNAKPWLIGGAALLLVMVGSFGAFAYFRPTEDPKLANLRKLDAEIEEIQNREDAQPDDQIVIQALYTAREELVEGLSDEQHAVLQQRQDEQREKWMQEQEERMSERLAAFFAMPKEERLAAVDKMIESSEARRKAMEALAAGGGGGPPGAGGGPPGGEARGGRGDGGGQRTGGSARRNRGNATAEQRKNRERSRLNRSTPDYRAQRTEFVRVVQERRKERGMQPASMRQLFGMYRQLAPPSQPPPSQPNPARS